MASFVPVIVGVGEVKNKTAECIEPLDLIATAVRASAADARDVSIASQIDSVSAVRTWTWPYDDLAGHVAERLNAQPSHTFTMERHSGHSPAFLLDEAAKRVATGQAKLAVVTGGEALASLNKYVAEHRKPPPHWTKTKHDLHSVFAKEIEERGQTESGRHGISAPIQVYPLYENAFRAARGQSLEANHRESAELYGEFAATAAKSEYSWNHGKPAETAASIATVSPKNRMICFPYPLLMNAFNTVNLAAAVLVTSTEHATHLGIPESKWIYPLGGAGTAESGDFMQRTTLASSACIAHTLTGALGAAGGLTADDVAAFDFYSCFPIVPKLACAHLGLPAAPPHDRPVSLLGGLTSFGGAGNNYGTHAIAAMVRHLRARRDSKPVRGLVLANGGVATHEHAVVLATMPGAHPYPLTNPLPHELPTIKAEELVAEPNGPANIETYTVDFARDGLPATAYVVGRLVACGRRFVAVHGDGRTLAELAGWQHEGVGRRGVVKSGAAEDGLNAFWLDEEPKI